MRIDDASKTLITGMSGSGKTTFCINHVKGIKRLVAFDAKEEWCDLPGFKRANSLTEVRDLLAAHWQGDFKVAYVPDKNDVLYERLHYLCELLFHVQQPYKDGKDRRELTMLVEEMDESYPAQSLPRKFNAMQGMVLRGRAWGINQIAITQRPAVISKSYTANVRHFYIFMQAEEIDTDKLAKMIGKAHKPKIEALSYHEYMHFDKKSRAVKMGKNPPLTKKQ